MKKIIVITVIACGLFAGCAFIRAGAKTINDIASVLCEVVAVEQTPQDLDGMSAAEWCAVKKNLDPFLNVVLAAKQEATDKAGFAKPEECKPEADQVQKKPTDGGLVDG